jgi:primosomal protein N''
MQTDILLKQLYTSLGELKASIDKFERHPSPSTQYAEQLHSAIYHSNKLVSAYLVLKEHKDVSPELNLHLKLMNVPSNEEKAALVEPMKEQIVVEVAKEVEKTIEVVQEVVVEKEIIIEALNEPVLETKSERKELPKIAININDKFRFINELFDSNANEYNIAIEQINSVNTLNEMNNYLKGLTSIYHWKEDNEVVKNLFTLAQKRFS